MTRKYNWQDIRTHKLTYPQKCKQNHKFSVSPPQKENSTPHKWEHHHIWDYLTPEEEACARLCNVRAGGWGGRFDFEYVVERLTTSRMREAIGVK